MTFALDTNIISYILQDQRAIQNRVRKALLEGNKLVIPPMSYYEVRRGLLFRDAQIKSAAFERICSYFPVGEMTIAVFEEAAHQYAILRHAGIPVDDADLLIAAFCLVNRYTLITNNVKHFEAVSGLLYENWMNL